MRNRFLDSGTAREIDGLVDRVHRDLGSPDRAVELVAVRDVLRLDLQYYSVSDPGLIQERGTTHIFYADTFGNSYQVLTLVSYLRPAPIAVAGVTMSANLA